MLVDDAGCFEEPPVPAVRRRGGGEQPIALRHMKRASTAAVLAGRMRTQHANNMAGLDRCLLNPLPTSKLHLIEELAHMKSAQDKPVGPAWALALGAMAPGAGKGGSGEAAQATRFRGAVGRAMRKDKAPAKWDAALRAVLTGPAPPPPAGRAVEKFGAALSEAQRARLVERMEQDASDETLKQLRRDARKPGASGVSAWRTFVKDERTEAGSSSSSSRPRPAPQQQRRRLGEGEDHQFKQRDAREEELLRTLAHFKLPRHHRDHDSAEQLVDNEMPWESEAKSELEPAVEDAALKFERKHQLAARQALHLVHNTAGEETKGFSTAMATLRHNRLLLPDLSSRHGYDSGGGGNGGYDGDGDGSWGAGGGGGSRGGGAGALVTARAAHVSDAPDHCVPPFVGQAARRPSRRAGGQEVVWRRLAGASPTAPG